MNSIINCHYVSRFIVRPWAATTSHRPSVDFLNVRSRKIERRRIEKLFTIRGLNSERIEKLLERYIETPIAQKRDSIISHPPSEIKDWNLYSALRLLFSIQLLRYQKASRKAASSPGLDYFLEQIDTVKNFKEGLVFMRQLESRMLFLKIRDGDFLFYPETGYFSVPLEEKRADIPMSPWTLGWVVPFAPRLALIEVPNDAQPDSMRRMSISAWSTFPIPGVDRYVIAPQLRERVCDAEIVDEFFRLRQGVEDTWFLYSALTAYELLGQRLVNGQNIAAEMAELCKRVEARLAEIGTRQKGFLESDPGKRVVEFIGSLETAQGIEKGSNNNEGMVDKNVKYQTGPRGGPQSVS